MSDQMKAWIESRIENLTAQYELAETVFEKQRIGPKRTAYKEVLQWINDHPQSEPRWTPIEEAGEWDGEMNVCVIELRSECKQPIYIWNRDINVRVVRAWAQRSSDSQFFVYPAPPEFNPEDYEVKPCLQPYL